MITPQIKVPTLGASASSSASSSFTMVSITATSSTELLQSVLELIERSLESLQSKIFHTSSTVLSDTCFLLVQTVVSE